MGIAFFEQRLLQIQPRWSEVNGGLRSAIGTQAAVGAEVEVQALLFTQKFSA